VRSSAQALRDASALPHVLRGTALKTLARRVKLSRGMADTSNNLSWTIPLHVIMWTTIAVGLIMALAVFLMH
jgi:hypothetical protein